MAVILTKRSNTASSVPVAGDLTNSTGGAELAVNTADKRLFTKDSGGTVVELGTNPSTFSLPNGTANSVPYLNGSKVLTSGSALTFDGTSLKNSASSSGATPSSNGNQLVLESSGNAGLTIATGASSLGNIFFADSGDNADGFVQYDQSGRSLRFGAAASERARIDSSGNLGLGVTPSAWGQGKAIDINTNMGAWASGSGAVWSYNTYFNSGYKYKTSDVATMYVQGSQHQWHVAPSGTAGNAISFTQAMTLDASGNLGVGTTSPAYKIDVSAGDTSAARGYAMRLRSNSTAAAATLQFTNNSVSQENGRITVNDSYVMTIDSGTVAFSTAGTERARIDSSGKFLVALTSAYGDGTFGTPVLQWAAKSGSHAGAACVSDTTAAMANIIFKNPNGVIGQISTSGSATSYITSSDYRMKNTIAPMTGALAKVQQLKPVVYKWNADGSDGEGFIAHELAEVCPQAVTGEKDAVDADGNPVYQGIDTSFLVATLTAAIQELKAEVDALKSEINTLKGI